MSVYLESLMWGSMHTKKLYRSVLLLVLRGHRHLTDTNGSTHSSIKGPEH